MILIDTNIFVDHLRGYKPAINFFESILEREDILFSAITESELVAGKDCEDFDKKEKLLHFLHTWEKIPVSNIIAIHAGDISRNHNISIPDSIIAATAILTKSELLTKNVGDFKNIENLKVREPY